MPPEYAVEGIFSFKSDVFSFGVLVLEIVTGRKNSSFYHLDRPLTLIGYVSLFFFIIQIFTNTLLLYHSRNMARKQYKKESKHFVVSGMGAVERRDGIRPKRSYTR